MARGPGRCRPGSESAPGRGRPSWRPGTSRGGWRPGRSTTCHSSRSRRREGGDRVRRARRHSASCGHGLRTSTVTHRPTGPVPPSGPPPSAPGVRGSSLPGRRAIERRGKAAADDCLVRSYYPRIVPSPPPASDACYALPVRYCLTLCRIRHTMGTDEPTAQALGLALRRGQVPALRPSRSA